MNNPADTLAARRTHIEVLRELRNDTNPEGADPYGNMIADALDAGIAALASLKGEAAKPAPDGDIPAMADSWLAVCNLLNELCPDWLMREGVGRECALAAIRQLATPPAPQAGMSALNGELERFKVQVEKRLCAIIGKHWQPAGGGICIDNLCEEIAARIATNPTPSPAPQREGGKGREDEPCQHWQWDSSSNGQGYVCSECGEYMKDCEPDFVAPPAQQPGEVVTDAMVERMAKWLCRQEIGESATLDEVAWRMTKWERYVGEARAALTAALAPKEKGNGR